MIDQTRCHTQSQSFLLRLTRYDDAGNWRLLLKPIDGDEHFLFADVASFVDTLVTMTTPNTTAPQPGALTERRDE